MKEDRPMLMSAPMVRAILDGRKTQTRRIVKPQFDDDAKIAMGEIGTSLGVAYVGNAQSGGLVTRVPCPYGQPGDRLWVREAWRTYQSLDSCKPRNIIPGASIQYEAGGTNISRDKGKYLFGVGRLRSSMFMPRWASRITLEITSIRVERLYDISQKDAMAEGVTGEQLFCAQGYAPQAYRKIWESIHGAGSWDANPWVWVVEFERVQTLDKS